MLASAPKRLEKPLLAAVLDVAVKVTRLASRRCHTTVKGRWEIWET
jgi:hypothetical protein